MTEELVIQQAMFVSSYVRSIVESAVGQLLNLESSKDDNSKCAIIYQNNKETAGENERKEFLTMIRNNEYSKLMVDFNKQDKRKQMVVENNKVNQDNCSVMQKQYLGKEDISPHSAEDITVVFTSSNDSGYWAPICDSEINTDPSKKRGEFHNIRYNTANFIENCGGRIPLFRRLLDIIFKKNTNVGTSESSMILTIQIGQAERDTQIQGVNCVVKTDSLAKIIKPTDHTECQNIASLPTELLLKPNKERSFIRKLITCCYCC